MALLEASKIAHGFGSRIVLGPLDLKVEAGEKVALMGDNGSGKTTLLRILATLTRPLEGTLSLFAMDAARHRERIRPRLGHLGHASGVYPALTARQNLEFFCDLYRLPRARARESLLEVGLEAASELPASQLSRGMEQRLALARSLLHNPELVLLDEPDSSLDETGKELLPRLLRGRTAVVVTHDLDLAGRLCERLITLRRGRFADGEGAIRLVQ